MLPFKVENGAAWSRLGCNKESWRRSSLVPRGVWGHEAASLMPHRDPTNNRILTKHNYDFLGMGPGAIGQGRGAERPKGME
jgi:hypothetical protein